MHNAELGVRVTLPASARFSPDGVPRPEVCPFGSQFEEERNETDDPCHVVPIPGNQQFRGHAEAADAKTIAAAKHAASGWRSARRTHSVTTRRLRRWPRRLHGSR